MEINSHMHLFKSIKFLKIQIQLLNRTRHTDIEHVFYMLCSQPATQI